MRRVPLTISILLVLVLLSGCGKSESTDSAAQEKKEQQVVTESQEEKKGVNGETNLSKTGYYLGKTAGKKKDSGYSGKRDIDKKDPHYGWDLGSFYISGYTSQTTDATGNVVFLKTIGDEISLNFVLEQDINKLNGNKDFTIARDKKGYDKYFGVKQTDFGKGMLIIRHTDYQNNVEEPILYADFLTGLSSEANTTAILLEEGDYEVTLDYRIKENNLIIDDYYDYCIFFTFSIRNGNCMAFPFEIGTGKELLNCAYTENGFVLDLANSHYLDIFVKRETYVDGADGLTEDVRFNGPAKEEYEYSAEGIYTITVKNPYINEPTIKKIYVGTNPILKAYVVNDISIAEIKEKLEMGYVINDDGSFSYEPVNKPTETNEYNDESEVNEQTNITDEKEKQKESTEKENKKDSSIGSTIGIIAGVMIILLLCAFTLVKRKKYNSIEGIIDEQDKND